MSFFIFRPLFHFCVYILPFYKILVNENANECPHCPLFPPLYLTDEAPCAMIESKLWEKELYFMADVKKGEGLVYKNHPLRRVDNLIYYGSMADEYIVMLQILETKKEKDMDVASRVSVQLQLTAPDLKSRDRVVKKTEKDSLYAAMDVGSIWLERALAGK
jgi:hypothetical protein